MWLAGGRSACIRAVRAEDAIPVLRAQPDWGPTDRLRGICFLLEGKAFLKHS